MGLFVPGVNAKMLINISTGAVLEIINDKPTSIGWKNEPSKNNWLETKKEVENLLGYTIIEWGAFTNNSTNMFWIEIGNIKTCTGGDPPLVNLLTN
jgi:hypothetical protein